MVSLFRHRLTPYDGCLTTTAIPADARLVCDFLNSYDVEQDNDAWSEPRALTRWLTQHVGVSVPLRPADAADAIALRGALRAALAGNETHPLIDDVLARFPLRLALAGGVVPASAGANAAIGAVAAAAARCICGERWDRIKVCQCTQCRWAFYDATRNRSRTWCSMRVCGNRQKTRGYRERQRGDTSA